MNVFRQPSELLDQVSSILPSTITVILGDAFHRARFSHTTGLKPLLCSLLIISRCQGRAILPQTPSPSAARPKYKLQSKDNDRAKTQANHHNHSTPHSTPSTNLFSSYVKHADIRDYNKLESMATDCRHQVDQSSCRVQRQPFWTTQEEWEHISLVWVQTELKGLTVAYNTCQAQESHTVNGSGSHGPIVGLSIICIGIYLPDSGGFVDAKERGSAGNGLDEAHEAASEGAKTPCFRLRRGLHAVAGADHLVLSRFVVSEEQVARRLGRGREGLALGLGKIFVDLLDDALLGVRLVANDVLVAGQSPVFEAENSGVEALVGLDFLDVLVSRELSFGLKEAIELCATATS